MKIFKSFIAFTLCFTCLLSCSSDDGIKNKQNFQDENLLKLKYINIDELRKNESDYGIYQDVEKRLKSSGGDNAKMAYDSIYKFYINTDKILYLDADSLKIYTFAMYRKGSDKVENLVIKTNNKGEYSSVITKYNLTYQEQLTIAKGGKVDMTDKMDIEIVTMSGPCYAVFRVVSYSDIPGQLEYSEFIIVEVDCPGSGGGGGSGEGGSGSGEGGSSSGGGYGEGGYVGGGWGGNDFGGGIPGGYVGGGGGFSIPGPIPDPAGGKRTYPYDFTYADIVTTPVLEMSTFIADLTPAERGFWFSNEDIGEQIWEYMKGQNFSPESQDFAQWAINYFVNNPTVTYEQFQNWFMAKSEGQDGEYDAEYWENPDLTFVQQDLPSWVEFEAAFPFDEDPLYDSPQKMYESIGGDVAALYSGPNTNTCAIRLSKALNYSGVVIPYIPGKTFKGADNKYYFKAAYEINLWMRKTFGTNDGDPTTPFNANHYHYTGAQAGNHGINMPALLTGKKGIFSLYSSNFQWATGHADILYNDGTCGNNCHYYDAPIAYIDIWILE